MVQLVERSPRDHAANLAESRVRPLAVPTIGESHPYAAAMALDGVGQGTIVNHLPANRRNTANFAKSFGPDQSTSSGRSDGRLPSWRIQEQKEKDESRNER